MTVWFRPAAPRLEAVARLFCFHHAGGGASAFAGWPALAPSELEICPVQLPGRENRLGEPAFTAMERLAPALADAIGTRTELPFAFFGHSMGARVAHAVAAEIAARGRAGPSLLIVSASRAPHHPPLQPDMHRLPDDRFEQELAALGGLPEAIRRSDEMMGIATRVARADFTLLETWRPDPAARLAAPILAFGGEDDALAPEAALRSWADLTGAAFRLRLFPGGHFYLRDHARAVVAEAASAVFKAVDGW